MALVSLDGETLTTEALYDCAHGATIVLTPEAKQRIVDGRSVVSRALATGDTFYGINTGFGLFSNVCISDDKIIELQENLIRSHASGVGEPLSINQTRMLLALRINILAKGHSGIRLEIVEQMVAAYNHGCLPVVPRKGTVGASGDLAPLSHIALGLMGEGDMWDPRTSSISSATAVLSAHGLSPIQLGAKEGLAMINGTQLIAALGAEATERAARVARLSDYVAALTLEVLFGTVGAFDPLIRKHTGPPPKVTISVVPAYLDLT
jgi:histidine ammonia-lyase